MQVRWQWRNISKILKRKKQQSRILYRAKISCKNEGSKSFQTYKPERINRSVEQQQKKGKVLEAEGKWYQREYGSPQGMKSTRNANHMGTCIRYFFLTIYIFLKDSWLFKNNRYVLRFITYVNLRFITYVKVKCIITIPWGQGGEMKVILL